MADAPQIDLTAAQLLFDGEPAQMSRAWFAERLGPPVYADPDDDPAVSGDDACSPDALIDLVWPDLGIAIRVRGDRDRVVELGLRLPGAQLGRDNRPLWWPAQPFTGAFTVDGAPLPHALDPEWSGDPILYVDLSVGRWEVSCDLHQPLARQLFEMGGLREDFVADGSFHELVQEHAHPFAAVTIWEADAEQSAPPAPAVDLTLPEVDEPVLEFDTFAFKLAVMEDLMYDQGVLHPRFDVADFAEQFDVGFDPDDAFDDMIPEVRDWFEWYPIPARLAHRVREITVLGAAIYQQLVPGWDGEDELFEIARVTERELAQFEHLRLVHGAVLGEEAERALRARGVEIEEA